MWTEEQRKKLNALVLKKEIFVSGKIVCEMKSSQTTRNPKWLTIQTWEMDVNGRRAWGWISIVIHVLPAGKERLPSTGHRATWWWAGAPVTITCVSACPSTTSAFWWFWSCLRHLMGLFDSEYTQYNVVMGQQVSESSGLCRCLHVYPITFHL